MAREHFNWNAITEKVSIGSCPTDLEGLRAIMNETQCTAILSLQTDLDLERLGVDWYDLEAVTDAEGVVMKRVPMKGFDNEDQRRSLGEAVHCLASLVNQGLKVYVHGVSGQVRAPLVVLGFLTFCEGVTVEEALILIRQQRPEATPPVEVWRETRGDLLSPREEQVLALSQQLDEVDTLDGGVEAEAERRILRSIFLPAAT